LRICPARHKLSIDLNKSTSEEDPWEDRDEIGKNSKRKKPGKKRKVIKNLKKHNKQLKKKNSRLHKRMTKLVKKHNKLCDFSQKLMKKNKKLYWTTRVLKTKWLQEKFKHQTHVQG
jgi:predicted RNase H-like nuclease (RuvC/YqgF family)